MTDKTHLVVYGHSDDLVEVRGDVKKEMQYPYGNGAGEYYAGGVLFTAQYDGEWSFDIWDVDQRVKVMKFEVGHGPAEKYNDYTQMLSIYTPEEDPQIHRM